MRKSLIAIYFTIMILIQFGFLSLIFYEDVSLSLIKKLLLITILIYIIIKSGKYKFRVTRDVAALTLIFSIIMSFIF